MVSQGRLLDHNTSLETLSERQSLTEQRQQHRQQQQQQQHQQLLTTWNCNFGLEDTAIRYQRQIRVILSPSADTTQSIRDSVWRKNVILKRIALISNESVLD